MVVIDIANLSITEWDYYVENSYRFIRNWLCAGYFYGSDWAVEWLSTTHKVNKS